MNNYLKISLLFLISTTTQFAEAQITLSDSAKISLMTTSPWSGEAYAMYGHTAIYVEDDSLGIDATFNYGFFDKSQPMFMYNFVRGKTDYVLGVQSFDDFVQSYGYKGVEVVKQELNLSKIEKQNLWDALYINQLPENRGYRYNYFFDNCVTRPRDLLEKYTNGEIQYPQDSIKQTYRYLIHECVGSFPWMKFGIDLVIGSDADKPITLRQKMFLPAYLMNALDETTVSVGDTLSYPIIKDKTIVLEEVIQNKPISEWHLFSPNTIAFALLLITIIISLSQYTLRIKPLFVKIYDTILFATIGVGGVIIFFLMFFSEHPAVNNNWNFVWMNVFALLFALMTWCKKMNKITNIYHLINFAVLSLFLLFWWAIPQQLPFATIPLSMCLWLRSATNVFMNRKRKIVNQKYSSSKYLKAGWGD